MNERTIALCEDRAAALSLLRLEPEEPEIDPETLDRILPFKRLDRQTAETERNLSLALHALNRAVSSLPSDHRLFDSLERYVLEGHILAAMIPVDR